MNETTTTTDAPEGYHFEEWVAMARGRLVGGKLGVSFRRPDGTAFTASVDKVTRRYHSGGVYRVTVRDDGLAARFADPATAYLRLHDDADERRAWQLTDRTLQVQAEAERQLYKLRDRDEIGELLVPLRRVYAKGDRWQRCAIEALVLQALRNPLT